jgi:hypothetical protein
MHIRPRRNVVQLVRTLYDANKKKPRATVVGRFRRDQPVLGDDLRTQLTPAELIEVETWISTELRAQFLKEELAALTLGETMRLAAAWLDRNKGTPEAAVVACGIHPTLVVLRKALKSTVSSQRHIS